MSNKKSKTQGWFNKSKQRANILVLGSGIYARPFLEYGNVILVEPNTLYDDGHDWEKVKMVVFTGGHDVDPSLYSETKHSKTNSNLRRDRIEQEYYHAAIKRKLPIVGICRGSQFLTVMNGGSLIQHVNNHAIEGTHTITTTGLKDIEVTSTHHQMMYPKGKYSMLAWAKGLSNKYQTGRGSVRPKMLVDEPEVVWYPTTKSLAVQFHPEYMNSDSGGYKYFQSLIKEYLV